MTKEQISYNHFQTIDIRVGTIREVEIVPDADKLLRLMVEVGEGKNRQIVSGIREYFPDPEVLISRQTTFVCNLEPRTIRGLESNGMLFALGGGDACVLLRPDEEVEPGTPAV